MSTMSKVLVVLVLLLGAPWLFMIAGVAQLNRNGTQAVEEVRKQVVKVEQEVVATEADVERLRDQIGLEQKRTGEDLASIKAKQAAIEGLRTEALEIESRLKYLQEKSEASEKLAQTHRQQRIDELKAEEADLANKKKEVDTLEEAHSKLTDRLAQLRDEFKATYDSNKVKVDRLLK